MATGSGDRSSRGSDRRLCFERFAFLYRIKSLASGPELVSVEADDQGRVWLIMGTDSGFEGLTTLYYDRISFTLTLSD